MKRSTLVRWATFLATCFGVWGVLSIGAGADTSSLNVGDLAERPYEAQRAAEVVDTVATEQLEQQARASVESIWEDNPEAEQAVQTDVTELFVDVAASVIADPPPASTDPTLPSSTTTTTDPEGTTTSTVPGGARGIDRGCLPRCGCRRSIRARCRGAKSRPRFGADHGHHHVHRR